MPNRIRLLTTNHVDTATLTGESTNSFYPVANINDHRTTKEWRSTSASPYLLIDFGTAKNVTDFAIAPHSRDGFKFSTLTIKANSSDSWSSPAFSTTVTVSSAFGLGYKKLSETNLSYRYWRVELTSSLSYAGISNIFLGKDALDDPFERNINYKWTFVNQENFKSTSNRYGQKFIDKINFQKGLNFKFSNLNKADMETLLDEIDSLGSTTPFFCVLDPNEKFSSNKERFGGFYFLNKVPNITNVFFQRYDLGMNLVEAL